MTDSKDSEGSGRGPVQLQEKPVRIPVFRPIFEPSTSCKVSNVTLCQSARPITRYDVSGNKIPIAALGKFSLRLCAA